MSIVKWFDAAPYSWKQLKKSKLLCERLNYLTELHYKNSKPYKNLILNVFGGLPKESYKNIEDIPFVPVSLFKSHIMRSVSEDKIIKILKSSGTSNKGLSQIYLDRITAENQSKVLIKIMQYFLGKERMPMIILDHPGVIKNRSSFSARGAGILGLMQFGVRPLYALKEDMSIDLEAIIKYVDSYTGRPILFFGFTFMVWKYFVLELEKKNIKLKLTNGTLIHSGGWKKLEATKVSHKEFDQRFKQITGVKRTLNFYGMVEQVGGIFMENQNGNLNASIYSDIIIRDPHNLKALPIGQPGLVQVLSVLPVSYPGHSILTEDIGVLLGEDSGDMGGRYFKIEGRAPNSELRGCSDTFLENFKK